MTKSTNSLRWWKEWEIEALRKCIHPKQNRQERNKAVAAIREALPHRTPPAIRQKAQELKLVSPAIAVHWHPEELEILREYAGNLPTDKLVEKINRWRSARGYQNRSYKIVLARLELLGLSAILCSDRYLNQDQLATCLGVSSKTIEVWSKTYKIPYTQKGELGQKVYDCKHLKEVFIKYPSLLDRCRPDMPWLVMVLSTAWAWLKS